VILLEDLDLLTQARTVEKDELAFLEVGQL
jgi:hypothetical protein